MRVAICDDEQTFVNEISNIVEPFFTKNAIMYTIDTYRDSNKMYHCDCFYDIVFLDIKMEPYSGLKIAKKLKENNPNIIIFIITSHDGYLDDAMDLTVFRYISKPIVKKRLEDGLTKAVQHINNNSINYYLKKGNIIKSLSANNIIYIEINGRSTKVITTDGIYSSESKIDFWESEFGSSSFFRVHKSYLINLHYITAYQRDHVILSNEYKIPIAYRKQAVFKNTFIAHIKE